MHIPCQAWRMERLRLSQFYFITFMVFYFLSLSSILLAVIFSLFFLAYPSHPSIYHRHVFKNVHQTLCLFLFLSILLPNQQLPMETPTLGAHNLLLIQEFMASHFRLLQMGLCITEEIVQLLYLCCPDVEKIECVHLLMKAIQKDGKRQRRKICGKCDSTMLSCGLWMGVDILIVRWMDEEKKGM